MNTEPFWELIPNRGCELWIQSKSPMRSFSNLTTAVKYAKIDEELKELLLKKIESQVLFRVLLDKYFPKANSTALTIPDYIYLTDIRTQILEDSKTEYQKRLTQIRNNLDNEGFQEEIFVRGGIFKKEVPKIYNFTCCISGFRIDAGDNISMVDACHIIPFSEGFNDTISNGLSMCPNLHRAFDRGLISINNDFNVIVNKNFSEPFQSTYNIKQFEGKKITLPSKEHHYPSVDSLVYHRVKFGF
jgi:putative restriction endonuclease